MPENWRELSASFSAAILNPDCATPSGLAGPSHGRPDRRYAVYRNNATSSLVRALEANFPAVRRLVGQEFFAAMATIFIRSNPPMSRLLAEYGAGFADFIEAFEPLAEYPFIPDVARLERLWLDSYHEADAAPLDGASLAAIAPDQLLEAKFNPHPAARLFQSSFAAVTIAAANRAESDVPEINAAEPEFGLVTRPALQVDILRIPGSTHAFLTSLVEGTSLGQAAQSAFESDPAFNLSENIHGMLKAGVFSSVKTMERSA